MKKLREINIREFADVPPVGFDLSEDAGGVPDVVAVTVEDPHWKVGDGMNMPKDRYLIGQIAIVGKGQDAKGKDQFEIVFFDDKGKERGRIAVVRP